MHIFDGKAEAEKLTQTIQKHLNNNKKNDTPSPDRLLILQVGSNEASSKYIKLKQTLCEKLNIPVDAIRIDLELTFTEISDIVTSLFNDPTYTGGIIQLPLSDNLTKTQKNAILNLIPYKRDLDVLSEKSKKAFYSGDFTRLPPVVRALNNFLEVHDEKNANRKAIVLGGGELIGKPTAYYLYKKGYKVTVMDEAVNEVLYKTLYKESEKDFSIGLSAGTPIILNKLYSPGDKLNCDLLILGAGKPDLVKGQDISAGCNVVDFGSSVVEGKTVGDLDYNSKLDHLGVIAKSPGGMGPLVVRYLLLNYLGI